MQYFNEYFEGLHRYAYTMLKDADEAKDIVQSVFVQLWEKKDILQIKQSARSYLYTATHNKCLNSIRDQKKRKHHQHLYITDNANSYNMQKSIEAKEIRKEILVAMNALPEKCRNIFYKNRFEEKTYAEIATELEISIKTVESQMGKALSVLRTTLTVTTKILLLLWLLSIA